jgi:hypothetical protein
MKKTIILSLALFVVAAVNAGSFSGTFSAVPSWNYVTNYGSYDARANFAPVVTLIHTHGTNANQMTAIGIATGTLAPGQTNIINVATGTSDPFGAPLDIARVRFLAVAGGASNGEVLTVGGAESDAFTAAFTGLVTVRGAGAAIFIAPDLTGYAIGTSTNLQIANLTASNLTYTVWIGGSK